MARTSGLLLCTIAVWVCLAAAAQRPGQAGAVGSPAGLEARSRALPVWQEPAQPQRYLEASGRRSAFFGNAAGVFEAWTFPVKVCRDLRLLIQQEGRLDRAEADTLASRVEMTPAATTLVYSHAAFTIRETLWAPRDIAALVVELDVEASRPVTLFVQYRSELKPMWPAAAGGVYNAWLADEHAMLLGEPSRRIAALIGSREFDGYSDEGDHMLPDRPSLLRLKPFPAGRSKATIVIAGGMGDSAAARKTFRAVLDGLASLRAQLDSYWSEFLERTTGVETPDERINRAFLWGRIAMEKGFACNDGLGCGLIAGYGPSGTSERPGFGWYFGGDAFMNVPALLDAGDFAGARATLEFLRARQRDDGKMMHEMTMSAALMDAQGSGWFKLPYAYYHADTTPLYIVAAHAYFVRTGDRAFLEQSWPSLKKAFEYCLGAVESDGLMSNLKAGMAAVETGALRGKVQKDVYLQGFWLAALDAYAGLAGAMKQPEAVAAARERLERGRATVNSWFSEEKKHFAFGLLTDNTRLDALTDWPAVALAFAGLDAEKSRAGADALARPELSTDWGSRWVATDSGIYNPLGYNDGSVWPFMTGYVIQAQYAHHRDFAAWQQLAAMAGLTGFSGPGWLPENLSGDRRQALPHSVPHQLFSTGVGVLQSLASGMLGLSGDAGRHAIRFAPHLPAGWDFVRIKGYRVGDDSFDLEMRRQEGEVSLEVQAHASEPYELKWSPALPPGARATGVRIRHMGGAPPPHETSDRDTHVTLTATLKTSAELAINYAGGIELFAPAPEAAPGERTSLPRLVGGSCALQSCKLIFAGLSGREYELRYRVNGRTRVARFRIPESDREFGSAPVVLESAK